MNTIKIQCYNICKKIIGDTEINIIRTYTHRPFTSSETGKRADEWLKRFKNVSSAKKKKKKGKGITERDVGTPPCPTQMLGVKSF